MVVVSQNTAHPAVIRASEGYAQHLLNAGQKWNLHSQSDLEHDYAKAKLVASLDALGNPFAAEDIEKEFGIERLDGREAMIQLGRILVASLVQDIGDCLVEGELETLRKCHFNMVDIGETNALCADRDLGGDTLPGYVILLNQGLYFCIKLLMTAQIFEDLQGDYARYRRSGSEFFAAAVELFLSERPDKLNVGAVETGDERVDGTIEAHVSRGTILVMQFVMLHEVGHAHLAHGQLLKRSHLQALNIAKPVQRPASNVDAIHKAELEADAFAWRALERRAQDADKNFANFYVIRLLFLFLDAVEQQLGRSLSDGHPEPARRIQNIENLIGEELLNDQRRAVLNKQEVEVKRWIKQAACR